MSEMAKAVKAYLEEVLRERKFCPRCMGYLPRHEPDCALGKLMDAYQKEIGK